MHDGQPVDWSLYRNFSEEEFRCSHSGLCRMDPDFLERLQDLRDAIALPFPVSSGYRHESHPIEARKKQPGAHAHGCAADILCRGELAYRIVSLAYAFGFVGIGVNQAGPFGQRFIHLDSWADRPRPAIWSY